MRGLYGLRIRPGEFVRAYSNVPNPVLTLVTGTGSDFM